MSTTRAMGIVALAATTCIATACREGDVTPRVAVAGGDAARGRATAAQFGCGGCHVVPGIPGAVGRVGPPLDALAERPFLAGSLPNDAPTLVRWISDPQALRPGTAMPDLGVDEGQARDIAAYLYASRDRALGPPHLLPRRWLPSH